MLHREENGGRRDKLKRRRHSGKIGRRWVVGRKDSPLPSSRTVLSSGRKAQLVTLMTKKRTKTKREKINRKDKLQWAPMGTGACFSGSYWPHFKGRGQGGEERGKKNIVQDPVLAAGNFQFPRSGVSFLRGKGERGRRKGRGATKTKPRKDPLPYLPATCPRKGGGKKKG